MQVQRVVLSEPLSSQLQKVLDMDILREWSKLSETSMITIWSGLEMNITHFILKEEMGEEFGFPGYIGIGDGTYVQLAEQPWENGWSYWC